jgi:hypothetical protein
MTPFEVEVDVPESRQVTVVLPPGVRPGRVRLHISVESGGPVPGPTPRLSGLVPDPAVTEVRSGLIRIEEAGRPE